MESWRKLTECSICFDRLDNSKCLPCSHTFCCRCLEDLSTRYHLRVPCPLCRLEFVVPAVGCSKLPTNVYAEQLMRVGQSMEETETELKLLRNDFSAMKTQLKENIDARQKAIEESHRLDMALAEYSWKLAELQTELEQNLSAAESSDGSLQEMQRKILERLKGAERRHKMPSTFCVLCRRSAQHKTQKIEAEVQQKE